MKDFLPSKHTYANESVVGLAALILRNLKTPKTVDEIWARLRGDKIPDNVSFDTTLLAVDLLFLIGAVRINEDGLLHK
jgi:hypothetical protein